LTEAKAISVNEQSRRTSRYFKAMIWALLTPVIALIAVYQIRILGGDAVAIFDSEQPFFFISLEDQFSRVLF
jgi:hypothetical protein